MTYSCSPALFLLAVDILTLSSFLTSQVMTLAPVAAVPVPEEQMAWGFNTWFRKNHARTPVGY